MRRLQAMRGKKILKLLGYGAFTLAALLLSLYITFPAEAVGQRIEYELRQRTDGKVEVQLAEVSLYRLTGIEAHGVEIRRPATAGETLVARLDHAYARVRLLPLLLLRPSLSAGAELGAGSVDLVLTRKGEAVDVQLELDDVDLAKERNLAALIGLPLTGKIGGNLESALGIDAGDPKPGARPGVAPERTEGDAELSLAAVGIGPGTIQGFTIPAPLSLGSLQLTLEVRRGRVRVASFKQTGGQLAVDFSGSSNLRRQLSTSSLEACIKFKVTDETYLKQHPKIATALQLAEVQLKKDGEGFLHLPLAGTMRDPRRQRGLCRGEGRK